MSYPKPSRAGRLKKKKDQAAELGQYRKQQALLAINRDNDQCVFCYFLRGKNTPRAEVHHVYSRGKKAGDWREQYTSLLCTCRECHPLPIIYVGGSVELAYVEIVLQQANESPINKDFKHPEF